MKAEVILRQIGDRYLHLHNYYVYAVVRGVVYVSASDKRNMSVIHLLTNQLHCTYTIKFSPGLFSMHST